MQESATKGLESNGSDAEIRTSRISRISVEGYDTSLRMVDVDWDLREHLASCGNIIHVYVPTTFLGDILCRFSLIYINEEDEEKFLRLDGSEMGGRILKIKSYPFHENYLDEFLDPMKDLYTAQRMILVTGCDSSLPDDVNEAELKKYFSAHGSCVYKTVTASGATISPGRIYVRGQEGVKMALERSGGRSVGGLNFVVTRVVPFPKVTPITGYIHPMNLLTEDADENQKKKKKRKTRERNHKKKMNRKEKKRKAREENQKMKEV